MKQKQVKTRYYIKKEIDLIIMKINVLKQYYFIFKKLYFVDEYCIINKTLPNTMIYINTALIEKVIIELYKIVVDQDDNVISIHNFLKEFHKHRNDFREQKYIIIKNIDSNKKSRLYIDTDKIEKNIEELELFLNNNKKIINYINKDRNKVIAHNDRKMNFNKKYKPSELKVVVTYLELNNFIDELFKKMNEIYCTLYKIQYADLEGTDYELKYLNKILDEAEKKR